MCLQSLLSLGIMAVGIVLAIYVNRLESCLRTWDDSFVTNTFQVYVSAGMEVR